MKKATVCALLAALAACSSGAQRVEPKGGVLAVVKALTSTSNVTQVTITVTPGATTPVDLTLDPLTGTFKGLVQATAGLGQTVTAKAYAASQEVGSGSATVDVLQGSTASVHITILDSTGPAPVPDHGPIITSLVVSKMNPSAGESIDLTATAVDPDVADTVAYAWTQQCDPTTTAASFTAPAAAATSWTATTAATCTLTLRASSKSLSDSIAVRIVVYPVGTDPVGSVDVSASFVEQPVIDGIQIQNRNYMNATFIARTDADATFHQVVHPSEMLYFNVDGSSGGPDGGASPATYGLSDDCGGAVTQNGQNSFAWTAPAKNTLCIVTASKTVMGLVDRFPVALFLSGCPDDVYEPNDTRDQAAWLYSSGAPITGLVAANDDWYAVSTYYGTAGTTVKVLLNTSAQLPVEIVDPFGNVLGSGVNVATASLSGMSYAYNAYVHVKPPPGGACGVTYDLSIVTESAPSISISPPSALVQVNGTQYFSAMVNGINGGGPGTSTVSWSLSDPKCGTLTPSMGFNSVQYTAPAQAVIGCQLIATSTVDSNVSATASISIGAQNVTGTVSYAGTKKGRVYLTYAWGATGPTAGAVAGTSLDGPGPFTIRGVPGTGTATVMAWIDTLGIGRYVSGADPFGWVTLSGGLDAGTIALADPAVTAPPPMPQAPTASAGNAAASVRFTPPRDVSGFEIADHFNVYWSTTPSPGPTNNTGTFQVAAGANRARVKGLTNGDALYFGVSAVAGGQESAVASTTTPITIGIPAEPNHITGTVSFPAAALPGRLVVSATDTSTNVSYSTGVLDPAGSTWTYDVQVPDGTYNMTAYIDRGDDGYFGPTDLLRLGTFAPAVTVSGTTTASGPAIVIPPDNASAFITTTSSGNGASYTVNVVVRSNLKLPVNATIIGGPNVATIDLGVQSNSTNFGNATQLGTYVGRTTPPMVGDTYQVSVTYADGTSETLSPSVTGVLTSSPTPMSPIGTATSSTPTFAWSPPAMNGAATYAVFLYRSSSTGGSSQIWSASGIPGTVTSFTYNGAPLGSGSYAWSVRANDANNNGANSNLVSFSIP